MAADFEVRLMDGSEYRIVPERLTQIEGVDYVRCPTHGLIPLDHQCAKSAADHWCRAAAHPAYDPATGEDGLDDQATSHRDFADVQANKIHAIAALHTKQVDAHGGTDGFCDECDHLWPCRSVHIANGWGDLYECEEEGWCKHASVVLPKPEYLTADDLDGL